jgi:hypothetical protein
MNFFLKKKKIIKKLGGPDGCCAIAQDRQWWLERTNLKPPPRPRPPRTGPPSATNTEPSLAAPPPCLPEQLPYQPTDFAVAHTCKAALKECGRTSHQRLLHILASFSDSAFAYASRKKAFFTFTFRSVTHTTGSCAEVCLAD